MSGRISSAPRHRLEHAAEFLVVHFDPLREADLRRDLHRAPGCAAACCAFSRTAITSPALHWYDAMVTTPAVHRDRLVAHQLARFGARRGEAHAIHDVVEPALEQLQQVLARGAVRRAASM